MDETYVKVAGKWRYVCRAADQHGQVIDELIPDAFHNTGQYQNNPVDCDHGRLKAQLRPMRGLKPGRTASIIIRGHQFIQNIRRGRYEPGTTPHHRLMQVFDELAQVI